ncbi:Mis12 protein-domain-containing protein [Pilaira anomala]|nr:Mis12 protein-domain-containing protein [Pilaira anomala]
MNLNEIKTRPYSNEELLADLFGFSPLRLSDDFYNAMNDCLYNVVEGITNSLVSFRPDKTKEIEEAIKSFEKDVEINLDNAFNTFQEYVLSSVLSVPPQLDIKYDDINDIQTNLSKEHEDTLDENLNKLRASIVTQKKLKRFLENQLEDAENELNMMDECSELLSFLTEIPNKHNVIDIEFSAASLKDNIENLKEAVLQALPEIQDSFDQIEQEKRTVKMKSIIQARLKTIRQPKK